MRTPIVRLFWRGLVAAALIAGLGVYSAVRIAAQSGSITITGCSTSACVLKAGPDFATDAFADPWDFQQRSDVATDPAQVTGFTSLSIGNGSVTGTAANSGAHFAVLEQPWGSIINPGKTGAKFPIDTTKYTKLAVKFSAGQTGRFPRAFWSHSPIGGDGTFAFFDSVNSAPPGDHIYVIDLAQQPGWSGGAVQGLSFYPNSTDSSSFDFAFKWVRLTAGDGNAAATTMPISWSGAGPSNSITITDALSVVYTLATGVASSGAFNFNYGVLPPGAYTLKVGTLSKTFTINAPPLIRITEPDETGGADFATDVLHNPWDMNDVNDVFHNVNIVAHVFNESFTNGIYNAISDGVTVSFAGSVPVGDPEVYLLSNQKTSNTTDIIDTTRYHRLTFDMTIDRAFDLGRGSVARVFWGSDSSDSRPGGTPYNVTTTKDIIMWPGKNTYTIDLATLTTTNGGLEPGNATPWTQNPVRHFRIDPFEFAEQITFHMDNVKLAADDETVQNSFTIKWIGSDADAGDSPKVNLFYQAVGGSPTLITTGIPLAAGQYVWNTANVPLGTYYILAQADDGVNAIVNRYSTAPVKVSTFAPTSNPQIGIDTPTPSQVVTSSFEIGGWLLDANATSGTGVDDVKIYVQLPGAQGPGLLIGHGRLGLSRPDVGAVYGSQFSNSGFHYTITGLSPGPATLWVIGHSTVTNTDSISKSVPFTVSATGLMSVDVPATESTITANTFSVSGWAIDRSVETATPSQSGTGIDSIVVYAFHSPGSGEPAVFLGTATYGTIQRPDVQAFFGNRYLNCGYVFTVDRAAAGLGTGEYNFVPIAHSTITGLYDNLAIVRVVLK